MDELVKQLAEAKERLAKAESRADAAEAKVRELEAQAEKAKAELEAQVAAEKARADAAEKELEKEKKARQDAEDPQKLAERVSARVKLITEAQPHIDDGTDLAQMDDRAIKVAVVKKLDGDEIPDDAHDAYVQGRYEAAIKRAPKADQALAGARAAAVASRSDGDDPIEKARQAMVERNRNAWKQDLN